MADGGAPLLKGSVGPPASCKAPKVPDCRLFSLGGEAEADAEVLKSSVVAEGGGADALGWSTLPCLSSSKAIIVNQTSDEVARRYSTVVSRGETGFRVSCAKSWVSLRSSAGGPSVSGFAHSMLQC